MSRHLGPIIFQRHDGSVKPLARMALAPKEKADRLSEAEIQRLIHAQPGLIPMGEIEPAFADMVSVCMELPLLAGFLDNLWMTPYGGIVIGECKLFRNPQARREVVAQALDYARSLQAMSYEDFQAAIAVARQEPGFELWSFVQNAPGSAVLQDLPEEAAFIDGVTRRLRDGRVMVLVIGDGIHEGVESLTDYLQLHAGIHANLALIDLSFWEFDDGAWLVLPRLPLKTVTVVRGIVEIGGMSDVARVSDPARIAGVSPSTQRPRTGSEDEFFTMLERDTPASSAVVRELIDKLGPVGVVHRFTPQYIMFEISCGGRLRTLFDIKFNGDVWGGNLVADGTSAELVETLRTLLLRLGAVLGGRVDFTPQAYHRLKQADGRNARVDLFAGHVDAMVDVVREMVAAGAE